MAAANNFNRARLTKTPTCDIIRSMMIPHDVKTWLMSAEPDGELDINPALSVSHDAFMMELVRHRDGRWWLSEKGWEVHDELLRKYH